MNWPWLFLRWSKVIYKIKTEHLAVVPYGYVLSLAKEDPESYWVWTRREATTLLGQASFSTISVTGTPGFYGGPTLTVHSSA